MTEGKPLRPQDDGSRMSRETHVRFCEGVGVKLPRATHRVKGKAVFGMRAGLSQSGGKGRAANQRKLRRLRVVVVNVA